MPFLTQLNSSTHPSSHPFTLPLTHSPPQECQSIFDIVQLDLHSYPLDFININLVDDARERDFPPLTTGKIPTHLTQTEKHEMKVAKKVSSYQSGSPPPRYVRGTFKVCPFYYHTIILRQPTYHPTHSPPKTIQYPPPLQVNGSNTPSNTF